jgi:hypothetical protein
VDPSAWHRDGVEATEANVASRWFGVRAEYEPTGPAHKQLWSRLRHLGLSAFSFYETLTSLDYDPKRRGKVVLFRRDNGHDVLTYEYNHLSEVRNHVLSLASHLSTTHVFDISRELGLPMEQVVGPGTDDPPEPVEWREMATPHRTPW